MVHGPTASGSTVRANRRAHAPVLAGRAATRGRQPWPHSPRHQAARQRGAQTGERFAQAWQGIRHDRCDYQRPIPDAATLALQQLEAAVVYALVEGPAMRGAWSITRHWPLGRSIRSPTG